MTSSQSTDEVKEKMGPNNLLMKADTVLVLYDTIQVTKYFGCDR